MKMGKLLRRVLALFFAAISLWWLTVTSDLGVRMRHGPFHAGAQALSPSASSDPAAGGGWVKLLLSQSPHLRAGYVLVGQGSTSEADDPPLLSAENSLPDPDPAPEADLSPIEQQPTAHSIVAQTFLPTGNSAYSSSGGVFVYNRTHQAIDMEDLTQAPVTLTGSAKGPQILIVHTHATESYTQDGQDRYQESDPYRTTDTAHNIVRVGDEMAAAFAQAGLNVLHDRTLHDYPSYTGAYSRSRATVEEYLAAYPSISVVLDVHRDALEDEAGTVYKAVAGEETLPGTAQVMLVVGTPEAGGTHPNWRQNLSFAIALERRLNQETPTLARPITLRTSHYNQQLSVGSLLIEVGTHGNTLEEAINGARAFAQTTAPLLLEFLPRE